MKIECLHKLKIIEEGIISYKNFLTKKETYWRVITSQCEKCGDLHHYRHSLGDRFNVKFSIKGIKNNQK